MFLLPQKVHAAIGFVSPPLRVNLPLMRIGRPGPTRRAGYSRQALQRKFSLITTNDHGRYLYKCQPRRRPVLLCCTEALALGNGSSCSLARLRSFFRRLCNRGQYPRLYDNCPPAAYNLVERSKELLAGTKRRQVGPNAAWCAIVAIKDANISARLQG